MDLKRQVLGKFQESLRKVKRKNRRLNNMAFNNEEILTLAKAGFTAQQIAALNMVGNVAPTAFTTPPAAPSAPAPVADPTPAPVAAPVAAPTPAPTPAPQGATADDILKAISGLSAQVTTGLIQTTPQPTPATAESILAEIINPPQKQTN